MYLNGLCKECPTLVLWHWKSEYVLQLVRILDPCLAFSCPTVTGPQGLQNKKWARCETEWNSQDAESSETSQVWNEAKKIIGCRVTKQARCETVPKIMRYRKWNDQAILIQYCMKVSKFKKILDQCDLQCMRPSTINIDTFYGKWREN